MPPHNKDSNTVPIQGSPVVTESLLGDILSSAKQESAEKRVDLLSESFIPDIDMPPEAIVPIETEVKKVLKKSMSAGTFLRIVGAILLVTLIFFGAFLAYIVFNPGQASFFLSLGINPGDITLWLRQLVRSIFGIATFILAIVWIIYLFKAILTKKEYKKKKTISIILA